MQETIGHALTVQGKSGDQYTIFDPWQRVYHVRFADIEVPSVELGGWRLVGNDPPPQNIGNGESSLSPSDWIFTTVSTRYHTYSGLVNVGGDRGYIGSPLAPQSDLPPELRGEEDTRAKTVTFDDGTKRRLTGSYAFVTGVFSAPPFPITDLKAYRKSLGLRPGQSLSSDQNKCTPSTVGSIVVGGKTYQFKPHKSLDSSRPDLFACRDLFQGQNGKMVDFVGTFKATCKNGVMKVTKNDCGALIPSSPRSCPVQYGKGLLVPQIAHGRMPAGTPVGLFESYYSGIKCVATCNQGFSRDSSGSTCSCTFHDSYSNTVLNGTVGSGNQCAFSGCPAGTVMQPKRGIVLQGFGGYNSVTCLKIGDTCSHPLNLSIYHNYITANGKSDPNAIYKVSSAGYCQFASCQAGYGMNGNQCKWSGNCPQGTVRNKTGARQCLNIGSPCDPADSSHYATRNGSTNRDLNSLSYAIGSSGYCQIATCKSGYVVNSDGSACVRPTPPPTKREIKDPAVKKTGCSNPGSNGSIVTCGTSFRAEAEVYGTYLKLVAEVGPNRGIARITIDSRPSILIDLYETSSRKADIPIAVGAAEILVSAPRVRKVVVEYTGQKNSASSGATLALYSVESYTPTTMEFKNQIVNKSGCWRSGSIGPLSRAGRTLAARPMFLGKT